MMCRAAFVISKDTSRDLLVALICEGTRARSGKIRQASKGLCSDYIACLDATSGY